MSQQPVATTVSNPHSLPSRYEIRKLTENDIPWICAIVLHTNMFHSKLWPMIYPDGKTARCLAGLDKAEYLVRHQVESGHSHGVFDTEYQYKTEEARKAGGKLLWDVNNIDATGEDLLRQMDFPLASVALAYDGINPLDMERIMPLIEILPTFGTMYHHLEVLDPRDPASWKPKEPNEILLRNATSTRHDYEGQRLMRELANYLMRYADGLGFRGIQIECAADPVTHVWSHPPEPFKAIVVSRFRADEYSEEQEVDGVKRQVNPFEPAKQEMTKVYVTL